MASNTNIRLTVDAWADIVTSNWLEKIHKLKIGVSFQLEDSIQFELIGNSGRLPERIDFSFKYYGKFVDMGVGKNVTIELVNDKSFHRRRPKKWYTKVMYSQVMKLRDLLAKKYGHVAAISIVENIDDRSFRFSQDSF